jgi:hypothetical protein
VSELAIAAARLAQLATFYDAQPRPPVHPRRVERTLAEIRRSIEPFELPEELESFWRAWDPVSFDKLLPFPSLVEPATALAVWRQQRYPVGEVPAVLFPIASQRSCLLQVELAHPGWLGPRVWFHAMADSEYELQAVSLAGYLHQVADAIVDGLVELPMTGRPFLGSGQADEWDRLVARSLDGAGVDPESRRSQDWASPDRWPERFRRAQGLDLPAR